MATAKRFEDLEAWKKARLLTKEVYASTRKGRFKIDQGLRNQLQRASVSIMANLAEGFGYKSDKQFIQYLNIARASGYEVQS